MKLKSLFTAALISIGLACSAPTLAQATSTTVGGQVTCNDSQWKQMGQLYQELNVPPVGYTSSIGLAWNVGTPPNKVVTVRVMDEGPAFGYPNETGRHQYAVGDISSVIGYANLNDWFYIECRIPTGGGSFANPHQATLYW